MATVGIVKAIVTADITDLKSKMTSAQRSMDNAGKNMSKAGKSMTMKVTMPLVGLGVAAAKMASDFEFSMTQIETLVGRSASEVETLKGAVLGLSGETGRAPKELADAMFFITSAGLDAASATAALEMSAKAAAGGLGDTSVVADAVTNAMNGYGMAADGAAFATDVLAKTVEQGKASAADLAPQFGRLIPMAAELGISFDQVGGGLAFLTRSSGDAALSATQLGGVMKSILKPSQQAQKTFDEIGVDLQGLRAAASTDLLGALQSLRGSLEANGKEMGDVFEDIRGLNGALMLTGEATGTAREVFDELANSSGKLEEAFEGVQKTAQFKLSQAMAGVKASMITLGGAILPVVVPILQTLASIISTIADVFGALPGPVQAVVVILGILVAAAGPLLMIAGSLVSAWGTLGLTAAASVAPIGAASAATATLGATAAATTISLSAILLPLLAIIAVAAAVFAVWKHFSNNAKEAQERTDTLRASFVQAENEAGLFKGELEGLRGELDALNDAADAADTATSGLANGFGALNSAGVLLGEVIERDVRKEFNKYITDMVRHNAQMKDGEDGYEDLADSLSNWSGQLESNIRKLDDHRELLGDDTDTIIAAVRAGELEIDVLKDMLYALDETADAHDDLAKENKKLAKEWLKNVDNTVAYVQALDGVKNANGDLILDLIELAEEEGRYVDAATLAIDATKLAEEAARENAEAERERVAAVNAGANALMGYTPEVMTASGAAHLLAERIAEMNAAIEAGEDPLGRSAELLAEIALEAADADRALFAFAERTSEAARNKAFWTAEANRQAEAAIEVARRAAHADDRRDVHTALREEASLRRKNNAEAEALAAAIENAADGTDLRLVPAFANASDEVIDLALGILDSTRNMTALQREAMGLIPPLEEAKEEAEGLAEALELTGFNALDANQEVFEVAAAIANAANEAELRLNPAFKNASDEVIELALRILDADRGMSSVRREALGLAPAIDDATAAVEELLTAEEQLVEDQAEAMRLARAMTTAQNDVASATRAVASAAEDIRIAEAGVVLATKAHEDAQDDVTKATDAHLAALDRVTEAKEDHVKAEDAVEEAVARATEAWERAADKVLEIKERQADIDQEILDIAQDRLDIDDEIEAITGRITENLAEQAALEEQGTEFAASIAQEFRKAALSVLELTDKVADLQNEVDAVAPDTATQEALIAGMRSQVAAVNDVEQALIDMGIISAEDAGMMDLTVREGKALVRLQEALVDTTTEYEAGEASLLDLMGATEDYDEAMNEARAESRELEQAVADLNEMISDGARIDAEREKATLKLAIAEEDLRLAVQKGSEEVFTANRIAEEQAVLEQARLKLLDKKAVKQQKESDLAQKAIDLAAALTVQDGLLVEAETKVVEALEAIDTAREEAQQVADEVYAKIEIAQDKVTEASNRITEAQAKEAEALAKITEANDEVTAALGRKAAADEELHYASVRLRTVMAEVNDLAKDGKGVWGELRDIIFAVTGEFRHLIDLLDEDFTPTGGGGNGGGGGGAGGAGGVPAGGAPAGGAPPGGGPHSGVVGHGYTPPTEWLMNVIQKGGLDLWNDISAAATTDASNVVERFNALNEALQAGHSPGAVEEMLSMFDSAQLGGVVKSGGLVNVHAGETITPAGGGVTVIVNVEGSVSSERDLVESIRRGLLQAQKSGRAVVL